MIPAQKGPRFNRWFAKQAEGRVHKTFGRVYVHGLDRLEATARDHPILLVSNHSAWWDSLFIIWLMNRPVQLDGYAMMDAQNLRALPFLGKVGAFLSLLKERLCLGEDTGHFSDQMKTSTISAKCLL